MQPTRGHTLLKGADGGTPQRFIWLPVDDADAPEVAPDTPTPVMFRQSIFKDNHLDCGFLNLVVPEHVRAEIDSHRLKVLHREDVDPLDGHKLICRLKVAAALMFLEEEPHQDQRRRLGSGR